MKSIIDKYKNEFLIIILGLILFIPFLGNVHLFDWDEVNFAEAAREMIVTGDYLQVRIDFEPFHEKPPLFIWMQVASMKVFGVNDFAARFPNALIGIITLLLLYKIGNKLIDDRFGLIWVLTYIGSFLPHFYFKTGIIDPTFNLLIFLGIYYLYKYYFEYKLRINKYLYISGLLLGLAVFTKGPVGILIPGMILIVFYIIKRKEIKFPLKEALIISFISLIPIVLWYLAITFTTGQNTISQFVSYQIRLMTTGDAGHGQPFYYHFVVLLFGCFPASILLLRGIIRQVEEFYNVSLFKLFMVIMLLVVLIVFSIVKTKIVHYSSMTYFPITFLASYGAYGIIYRNTGWKKTTSWLLGIIGTFLGAALIILPFLLIHKDFLLSKVNDTFTREILTKDVQMAGTEYFIGILFLALLIVTLVLFYKKLYLNGIIILFVNTALALSLLMPILTPKLEEYLQGTAIRYYQDIGNNKKGFILVHNIPNYKFGYMFYSNRDYEYSKYKQIVESNNKNFDFENWLFKGEINQDLYVITKSTDVIKLIKNNPELNLIEVNYGIALLKRDKKI